jgi:penicillin amidase
VSMELMRRTARGTMAELYGHELAAQDAVIRSLRLPDAAWEEWSNLPPATRSTLTSYARGINAWLERTSPALRSLETTLLAGDAAPWTPTDSLLVLRLLALSWSAGWEQLDTLQPRATSTSRSWPWLGATDPSVLTGAPGARTAGTGLAGTRAGSASSARPEEPRGADIDVLEPSVLVDAARDMSRAIRGARRLLGSTRDNRGSNAWAVAPERTATGGAILAGDSHLELAIPALWSEHGMRCGELAVRGMGLPGVPWVLMGHNGAVAWSLTGCGTPTVNATRVAVDTTGSDATGATTVCAVPLDASGARTGARRAVERAETRIRVRGRHDAVAVMHWTRDGTLLTSTGASEGLLLQAPAIHGPMTCASALDALVAAGSGAEAITALEAWQAPLVHVVWADRGGEIGLQLTGVLPGIGAAHLPSVRNPDCGWVASANDCSAGRDHPLREVLEQGAAPGWRAQRIRELLARVPSGGVHDHAAILTDLQSISARELCSVLVDRSVRGDVTTTTRDGAAALAALREWDHVMDVDGAGPAAWAAITHLLSSLHAAATTTGDTGRRPRMRTINSGWMSEHASAEAQWAMIDAITRDDSTLLNAARSAGVGVPAEWNAALAWLLDAAGSAMRAAARRHGGRRCGPLDARLPHMRTVRIVHRWSRYGLLGSMPLMHRLLTPGKAPMPGSVDTIWMTSCSEHSHSTRDHAQTKHTHAPADSRSATVGPAHRMVIDLANPDNSRSIIAGGQSSHPSSPHATDQLGPWLHGQTRTMVWSKAAVATTHTDEFLLLPPPQPL